MNTNRTSEQIENELHQLQRELGRLQIREGRLQKELFEAMHDENEAFLADYNRAAARRARYVDTAPE